MNEQRTRAKRVFAGLLLCLGILVLRAGWIQIVQADEFADRAQRQHFTRVRQAAPRGRILDRRGRVLAASYHSCSIAVDPQMVDDVPTFATRLAFALGDPSAAAGFAERLTQRKETGARFLYLRRWVDRPLADRVKLADLPGVDLREEPRREYPHGAAAASLIGLVVDGKGTCGLEQRFDEHLSGVDGSRAIQRAAGGRAMRLFIERDAPSRRGRDLVTTIDMVLQQVAEDALDKMVARFSPKLACAIALDPHTGEVLALASRPGFDPAADRGPDVLDRLRIPAIHNAYPIGSVLKPLIVAAALTHGVVEPDQLFDCGPGYKFFGGRLLHDVKPNHVIDLETVLVKSSNIGMAHVGLALGIDATHDYLMALGFGRRTGIELPGERTGSIRDRSRWTERYTLISVSMGRELMVTPLQLTAAYAALANGGRIVRPTLVKDHAVKDRRIPVTPAARAFVLAAMERVVKEGTGRRARIDGVRVVGKTGSSKIELKGHAPKYVSSFVGFAPAEDPRLLVMVLADDPKKVDGLKPYGGTVAAPAARAILARGLPLISRALRPAFSGSGVRQAEIEKTQGKVRVAAVHWSSVKAEESGSSANGRNPGSADAGHCRRRGR